MNPENTNTWKTWVDWWPTYLIIGVSLAYFIDKSGVVQKVSAKLFTKKSE